MKKIINQPHDGCLGDELEKLLQSETIASLSILVAYAKKSGISRLWKSLTELKQRGGTLKVIVGIDQFNTSKEALEMLFEICDELYIYHNELPDQTYHPKVYMLYGKDVLHLYTGSSNLTAGGLYTNNEFNTYDLIEVENGEQREVLTNLTNTFSFYSDTTSDLCNAVTPDLIKELEEEGYIKTEAKLRLGFTNPGSPKKVRKKMFGSKKFTAPIVEEEEFDVVVQDPPYTSGSDVDETDFDFEFDFDQFDPEEEVYEDEFYGFWKMLSNNDVSFSSSPGQIRITDCFKDVFELGTYETKPSGSQQAEAFFNVIFEDENGKEQLIKTARAAHYIPAPRHKRKNSELRFTFRNRSVLSSLSKDDILEFTKVTDAANPDLKFRVKLVKVGTPYHQELLNSKDTGYGFLSV